MDRDAGEGFIDNLGFQKIIKQIVKRRRIFLVAEVHNRIVDFQGVKDQILRDYLIKWSLAFAF